MRTPATGKNANHPLAIWRKKRNLNQLDASFELGISLCLVSEIEKGRPVTLNTINKINRITGNDFTIELYKQHLKYSVARNTKVSKYVVL